MVIQAPPVFSPQQNTTRNSTTSSTSSPLTSEQYTHLERILLELVGPLAPTLLRQIASSAPTYQEVIDNLTLHLVGHQKNEFQQKSMLLLRQTTGQTKPQPETIARNAPPGLSDSFVRQCERELTDLIGPIARFLVQKSIKTSPQISEAEFVKILASQIPDPQKALQFQQRLLS